ncbi:MAG: hypothetical protein P4N59_04980, partial [Negativicutes bacterium]|nr:hypothetical protein [Negativicutes bacterium]
MKRRNFLKLTAASAASFVVTVVCGQSISPSPTARQTVSTPNSTLIPSLTPTPTISQPSATPTIGLVPAPNGGLGSNSNYFLYSDCNPVTGLSITIDITKDIISDIGFSFQLNAYSPQGANVVWQQYGITFEKTGNSPLKAYGWVDNWASASFLQSLKGTGNLINHRELMLTLPGDTLPAGYKIMMNLKYDKNENVIGVALAILDDAGKKTALDISLESLTYDDKVVPAQPVTSAGLAPINSFVLNLVGPVNGKHSYLSAGAGTFTYAASSPLKVSSQDPRCTTGQKTFTEESANSVYAALPTGQSQTVTQSFDTEIPHPYTPGIPFSVSQQFGVNQTDLFAVDSAGQLGVFYVLENGHWHSSSPKGPAGMARPGAKVAASQHFGINNQTDVFLVDQNGHLNVFWVVDSGDWNGPKMIGAGNVGNPSEAVVASQHFGVENRTDVFLINKNGQLNVFWALGSGDWNGPEPIGTTGLANNGAALAVSQRFGVNNQTDLFVVAQNGQLTVFSAAGSGGWSAARAIGPAGLARPGAALAVSQRYGTSDQTDVYVVDTKGQLNVFSAVGSGDWSGPQTIGPAGLAVSGAALAVSQRYGSSDQTEVLLFDKNGQLNVFLVDNTGQWSGPVTVGPQNAAPSGAPLAVSQQFGVTNRTDVF